MASGEAPAQRGDEVAHGAQDVGKRSRELARPEVVHDGVAANPLVVRRQGVVCPLQQASNLPRLPRLDVAVAIETAGQEAEAVMVDHGEEDIGETDHDSHGSAPSSPLPAAVDVAADEVGVATLEISGWHDLAGEDAIAKARGSVSCGNTPYDGLLSILRGDLRRFDLEGEVAVREQVSARARSRHQASPPGSTFPPVALPEG